MFSFNILVSYAKKLNVNIACSALVGYILLGLSSSDYECPRKSWTTSKCDISVYRLLGRKFQSSFSSMVWV